MLVSPGNEELEKILQFFPNLQILESNSPRFLCGEPYIGEILQRSHCHNSLTHVNFSTCDITAPEFANILRYCPNLQTLVLQNCAIQPNLGKFFKDLFHPNLKRLFLKNTGICDADVEIIRQCCPNLDTFEFGLTPHHLYKFNDPQ